MARNSKRLKAAYEAVDRKKSYPLAEAAQLVKDNAKAKFD
jgi:ribosomal protein L1